MGFFDRFKGKKDDRRGQKTQDMVQRYDLSYDDGTTAEIRFGGIEYVNGRPLYKMFAIIISKDGNTQQDTLMVEPVIRQTTSGVEDITEQYYREKLQSSPEDIKHFFALGIQVDPMARYRKYARAPLYIGGFKSNTDGTWTRNEEEATKQYYRELAVEYEARGEQSLADKHIADDAKARQANEDIMKKGRRLQDIYQRMQEGRASEEEEAEYYRNVSVKHAEDRTQHPEAQDGSNRYTGMV